MKRALVTVVAALALVAGLSGQAPARLVAIGDIHGDIDAFTAILQQAGLINAKHAWSGGKATFMQTGDYLDRGENVRAVLDLLMALERQAKRAGGSAQVLLGNHEAMNLLGFTRDANAGIYAKFADAKSADRMARAWDDYQKIGAAKAAKGEPVADVFKQTKEAFDEAHPLGYIEYREALGPKGTYGKWLRGKPMVQNVGGSIFMHAGIPPSSAPEALDALNTQMSEEVKRMDRFVQALVDRKLALPFFTFDEVLQVASGEIAAANAAIATARESGDNGPLASLDMAFLKECEAILQADSWLGLNAEGAMWWRGLSTEPDDPAGGFLLPLLQRYSAVRFVTGHTPTATRRITVRFGGRAVLIDTGMNKQYYRGNPSALEIAGEKLTAIYLDGKETLTP